MAAYILAIGGTGAKTVESIIHAAAVGLFSSQTSVEDLHILLIDPDAGNGNAASTQTTLWIYEKCYELLNTSSSRSLWMSSKIERIQDGNWSVFERSDDTLKGAFEYGDYRDEDPRKHLFDVLYTKEERELVLREGFRGRPAIGAAVISQLSQQEKNDASWQALIEEIDSSQNGGKVPKVFLCGSIFGGTGASGLPTLGRLLANKLGEDGKNLLGKIKFGCLLFLPYFQFSKPKNVDEEVFAKSDDFILKTEAALRYYANQDLKFDSVYLLGLPSLSTVDNFSTGGSNQRNPPHFLEFYGALALRDFLFTKKPETSQVTVLNREKPDLLTWSDIPKFNEVRPKMIVATRFAFAWLAAIVPDLKHAETRPRDVGWALKFFNAQELKSSAEQDNIRAISDWCRNYLEWLGKIGGSNPGVGWFNWGAFMENNGSLKINRDDFKNLADGRREINEILSQLYPKDVGWQKLTVGLAKALYQVIDREHK